MTAQIGTSVSKAASLLTKGELVAIPTETVYGLAGNGLDATAVANIFRAKERPAFDPMILHTDRLEKIIHLVTGVPSKLAVLADMFMPGPLSILLHRNALVPDITTSGLEKVAIRVPSHPVTQQLLQSLDFPLAAPSANPFGYVSPTTAQHVYDQLASKIPYILDGGPCTVGLESTIVEWDGDSVVVLRKGGITVEQIEQVVGKIKVAQTSSSNPKAPGMLLSHYSPKVRLSIDSLPIAMSMYDCDRIGYIGWTSMSKELPIENQRVLSSSGNLSEAARLLFTHIRALDQLDLDIIVAQLVPDQGLGRAINDKLTRAAV